MEGNLRSIIDNVRNMPKNKLFLYLFLFVGIVGGSVLALSFLQKETYSTLFSGLTTEDASAVVARLKEQKIPYRLGGNGTSIYVPKDKVYDVRLVLASSNSLPGAGGMGFELFDKASYGMTEFMQNINYKRAIQGELARTINQMPEVKASRVHLAIPEKTLFMDREKEVTASVFLKIKPGKMLAKEQVAGIVHLVAGSIEGLKPEHVVIIDASGKILYRNGDSNSAVVLSGQQFELQKSVERKLEESIQSMLDKFLPASKSVVRASVELNLRKVEKVEEEYAPQKTVISGEKKAKEKAVTKMASAKAQGVPGAASNLPKSSAKDAKAGAAQEPQNKVSETEREEAQTSYEVSKTVSKIVEPFGDIKRISLAIVVDGKYEKVKGQKGAEELKYTPRSQKELNDIKNLVTRAVGYNEERGDKVEVLNLPFEAETGQDERVLLDKAERKDMIYNVSQYAFYVVIVLAIFLFIIKPLTGAMKSKGTKKVRELIPVRQEQEESQAAVASGGPQTALAGVMRDKALVGSIIKEWVREGT